MARPVAKVLTGFCLLALLLALAMVAIALSRPAVPFPSLPKPNGYDDFVKAGQMISGATADYAAMNEVELRALVSTNSEALKLARAGFDHECRVPLDYSLTNPVHLNELPALKRLAQGLAAEGRLAELDYRPGDAADSYLTAVRLGCEASRGGTIIDSLVGIAIQAIGMAGLERVVPTLDARQSRLAAATLETIQSRQEPEKATLQQERAWIRRTQGFKEPIIRLIYFKSIKQSEQKWAGRLRSQVTRERLALVQLAGRAYELDKGERAKSLADLVPEYLKTVPQDPLTGTNMTYRP
jgi:hypothetical protein